MPQKCYICFKPYVIYLIKQYQINAGVKVNTIEKVGANN